MLSMVDIQVELKSLAKVRDSGIVQRSIAVELCFPPRYAFWMSVQLSYYERLWEQVGAQGPALSKDLASETRRHGLGQLKEKGITKQRHWSLNLSASSLLLLFVGTFPRST